MPAFEQLVFYDLYKKNVCFLTGICVKILIYIVKRHMKFYNRNEEIYARNKWIMASFQLRSLLLCFGGRKVTYDSVINVSQLTYFSVKC